MKTLTLVLFCLSLTAVAQESTSVEKFPPVWLQIQEAKQHATACNQISGLIERDLKDQGLFDQRAGQRLVAYRAALDLLVVQLDSATSYSTFYRGALRTVKKAFDDLERDYNSTAQKEVGASENSSIHWPDLQTNHARLVAQFPANPEDIQLVCKIQDSGLYLPGVLKGTEFKPIGSAGFAALDKCELTLAGRKHDFICSTNASRNFAVFNIKTREQVASKNVDTTRGNCQAGLDAFNHGLFCMYGDVVDASNPSKPMEINYQGKKYQVTPFEEPVNCKKAVAASTRFDVCLQSGFAARDHFSGDATTVLAVSRSTYQVSEGFRAGNKTVDNLDSCYKRIQSRE